MLTERRKCHRIVHFHQYAHVRRTGASQFKEIRRIGKLQVKKVMNSAIFSVYV
ncbi:hypothetical protein AAG928_008065 [Enterobacter hormaechei]